MKANYTFKKIKCNVCSNEDYKVIGFRGGEAHRTAKGEKTRIVKCSKCGFLYANPMPFVESCDDHYSDPKEYFTESYSNHSAKGFSFEDGFKIFKERSVRFLADVEKYKSEKGKFLDVGCGLGTNVWAANNNGWDAVGVDVGSNFDTLAKKELNVEIIINKLEDVKFEDNSFDVIILNSVLEHTYEPYELLCEVRRILKDDGIIFIQVPNELGLFFQIGNLFYKLKGLDWCCNLSPTFGPFHVGGFSPGSMKYLLRRSGFDIVSEQLNAHIYDYKSYKDTLGFGVLKSLGLKIVRILSIITNSGEDMQIFAKKLPVYHAK